MSLPGAMHTVDQNSQLVSNKLIDWFINELIANDDWISLFSSFYSVPCFLAKWTCIFLLSCPSTDTVSVIGVVAGSPTDEARLVITDLVSLAFETCLVNTILADCTVFNSHIPTPKCNCVPLFNFDTTVDLHLNNNLNMSRVR